jgi:hypothetical protein
VLLIEYSNTVAGRITARLKARGITYKRKLFTSEAVPLLDTKAFTTNFQGILIQGAARESPAKAPLVETTLTFLKLLQTRKFSDMFVYILTQHTPNDPDAYYNALARLLSDPHTGILNKAAVIQNTGLLRFSE